MKMVIMNYGWAHSIRDTARRRHYDRVRFKTVTSVCDRVSFKTATSVDSH